MRSELAILLVAAISVVPLGGVSAAGPSRGFSASGVLTVQSRPQSDPPAVSPPQKGDAPNGTAPKQETPKADPPKRGARPGPGVGSQAGAAAKKPADKPGLAVAQPRSAAERDQALANLYAHLATAEDEAQAKTIAASIEALWATPGSDTISYLMQRANGALHGKNVELAIQLYDRAVALAPDYAEAWSQRAGAHFIAKDYERAMGDVRRTLALDANHFRALDGLFHILHETGRKKEALKVGRQLLEVHPFNEGTRQRVDELARELEGRGI